MSEGFEPDARKSYPLYTVNEIRKHSSIEDRVWVTYKDGVYDITDFVNEHPGGNVIMMAAGNAVDPFWALYGVHKQPHILSILEKYRIGKSFFNSSYGFVVLLEQICSLSLHKL